MKQFGLIGNPLTHSFSKKYFEEKFQRESIAGCVYGLFELKRIEELPALLQSNPDLAGLNVTIPYKQSVLRYLDDVYAEAKEIGAVNCIKLVGDGANQSKKLIGYNTDTFGFGESLSRLIKGANNLRAFVLGTGGSSKAVCYALRKMNIDFILVSREKKETCISYNEIEKHLSASNLYINTTPLGMFPDVNSFPSIPYHLLTPKDFLFDLVYNPYETEFLKIGKEAGARTKNGLEMLQLQSEKNWEIWNI